MVVVTWLRRWLREISMPVLAPKCRVCGERHWFRDPHIWSGAVERHEVPLKGPATQRLPAGRAVAPVLKKLAEEDFGPARFRATERLVPPTTGALDAASKGRFPDESAASKARRDRAAYMREYRASKHKAKPE